MSMDKLSGLNGRLPGSTKPRKQQESLHVPDSVRKWRVKALLFWLLGALAIGSFGFLLSFGNGPLRTKQKGPEFCEEKVQALLQHFNISKNQLHALASLFSESNQIPSLECTEEPGPEMQMSNAINCALKLLCAKRQEFQQQGRWEAEHLGPNGQCSIQDEGTFRKLDHTVACESIFFLLENEISSCSHHLRKENMLISEAGYRAGCHCKILCLVIRFWWILIGVIASWILYFFGLKFWRKQKHTSVHLEPVPMQRQHVLQLKHQPLPQCPPQGAGMWRKRLLKLFVFLGILMSIWLFWHLNENTFLKRQETLANMCDERARMLQDQFNVSKNHVNALAILVSTFHHGKDPSAINQVVF
uniref:Histidine kinase 1 2 3 plant n=1 Tax=Rhizophora mucronata TaxID=61149 RepID=A0A2P2LHG9_RHIMU